MSATTSSPLRPGETFSRRFVVGLTVVRGSVEKRGSLEKSRSWNTQSSSNTLGKFWSSGFFGAHRWGRSNTQEVITKSISIIKIGDALCVDLLVPGTAAYETLTLTSNVACILSLDKSRLYYVNNFTDKCSFGVLPNWGNLVVARGLCAVVGALSAWNCITTIGSGSSPGAFGALLAVGGLWAAWISHLALVRSREIWEHALQLVASP